MIEVEKFLQEHLKHITEQLLLVKHEEEQLQRKMQDTQETLEQLERDSNSGIQAFSPREMDERRELQIQQLSASQKERQSRLEECREQIPLLEEEKRELQEVCRAYSLEQERNSMFREDSEEKMRRKILEAQENERKRIAAELHDQSVQDLTGMVHKIELCTKLIQIDPVRCKLELMTMSNTIRGIIEEMRKMIYDLRPMTFDDIGFGTTVERALEKMQWESDTKIELSCDESVNQVDQVILITLLRIIMEACNNTIKYAKAKQIQVTVKDCDSYIQLEVADDGVGFDVAQTFAKRKSDNTGFGLQIMKERVALLSGTIEFQSAIGSGTKIVVKVPTCKEVE